MDEILLQLQARIMESGIKYVDEDWGQINMFPGDTPVAFPCCLFDVKNGDFENIGADRRATPQQRQLARFTLELCIAKQKLTNTSGRAPLTQKSKAWEIHSIIESVHEKVQGFAPGENCSKLIRKSQQRIRRDDGIQEYRITYDFEVGNV